MTADTDTVQVVFHTHYIVSSPTHELCVTGSSPYLGQWLSEKAFSLKPDMTGWWSGQVGIPAEESFEWQLIVREKTTGHVIRYEERKKNRFLANFSGNTMFHVFAYWNYHERFSNVNGECAESLAFLDVHQKYTMRPKAQAPILATTAASLKALMPASAQDTIQAPIQAPDQDTIQAPIQATGQATIQASIEAPIQAPAQAPIQGPAQAPIQAPAQAPIQAPAQAPIQAPAQDTIQAPIHAPGQDTIQAPIHAPGQATIQAPIQAPAQATIQAPVHAPAQAPIQAQATIQDPIQAPGQTTIQALMQATVPTETQTITTVLPQIQAVIPVANPAPPGSSTQDAATFQTPATTKIPTVALTQASSETGNKIASPAFSHSGMNGGAPPQNDMTNVGSRMDSGPDPSGRTSSWSSRVISVAMVTVVAVWGVVLTGIAFDHQMMCID